MNTNQMSQAGWYKNSSELQQAYFFSLKASYMAVFNIVYHIQNSQNNLATIFLGLIWYHQDDVL